MKALRFAVIIATMMATALHADDLAVSGGRDVTVLLFYDPDISADYERAFWLSCGRWLTESPIVPFPVIDYSEGIVRAHLGCVQRQDYMLPRPRDPLDGR